MNHPSAHRYGDVQDVPGETDTLEGVQAPCGEGQIDRAAALRRPGPRVGPHLDAAHGIPGPTQEDRPERAAQASPDENDPALVPARARVASVRAGAVIFDQAHDAGIALMSADRQISWEPVLN